MDKFDVIIWGLVILAVGLGFLLGGIFAPSSGVQGHYADKLMVFNPQLKNCQDLKNGDWFCYAEVDNSTVLLKGNCVSSQLDGREVVWCAEPSVYNPISGFRGDIPKASDVPKV